MPDYAIAQESAYDLSIVIYFFLGGLSAGAFLFAVAATYWKEGLRPLGRNAALLSPAILAVGLFVLWIHLGQPFRAWRLVFGFNPTSMLSWGVVFLNVFFVCGVLFPALMLWRGPEAARAPAYAGVPFAILSGAYTGALLMQAPGLTLWHNSLLPVLFLNGGLISGVALAILVAPKGSDEKLLRMAGLILMWLIVLEVGFIAVKFVSLANGGSKGRAVARALLAGEFAPLFLGVEIFAGAAVPVAVLAVRRTPPAARSAAAVLALVGVFAMRYLVVIGGQVIQ